MTKKYLALRVRDYNKLAAFLREQGVKIIHSRLETRDQALRNVTEGLFDLGVERVIDQHELRWMLVEGELDDETINSWSLCDLAMDVDWFDQYKQKIRHCGGVAYWDATYGLAKELSVKPQDRTLSYQVAQPATNSRSSKSRKKMIKKSSTEKSASITNIDKSKKSKKCKVDEFQLDLFG